MASDYDKELLEEILPGSVVTSGYASDHLQSNCPFCEKENHFYINWKRAFKKSRGNYQGSWDCKKCGESGAIPKLLMKLGRLDLISGESQVDLRVKLENKIRIDAESKDDGFEIDTHVSTINPPVGWKRVYVNDYLDSRGFTSEEYDEYQIGVTKIYSKLKGYVVFLVEEDGECKGWVARSTKTKEELSQINDDISEYNIGLPKYKKKRKELRYINSPGTDFSKLIFGIDELNINTKTAILVEGIMDKRNVDKQMLLSSSDRIKCLSTFGKKVSKAQIAKLQRRGIENIIILFDPDAVNDSKKYAYELDGYFNVLVGFLKDKDPGDLTHMELEQVMDNLNTPLSFNVSKVHKHELE